MNTLFVLLSLALTLLPTDQGQLPKLANTRFLTTLPIQPVPGKNELPPTEPPQKTKERLTCILCYPPKLVSETKEKDPDISGQKKDKKTKTPFRGNPSDRRVKGSIGHY